ncbi:LuxR family transcriptional regulator [Leifsonia xyli subsp. cynodontis DSM 46306]|uniref:HTH luxR-type domain-containing protein n=1 Tax=Leifsonia xyli subsp. cynodontis DSM 46306 TaxID=1389489 RepID=U3P5P9_LEIXC|nr:helix-turn-helix transcriptional regulator [Leifsonia xyli]AGW40784.1 LuxR family transcriptional regulator [Leifsonia xyli subsp. cynodontis DSM 46306]
MSAHERAASSPKRSGATRRKPAPPTALYLQALLADADSDSLVARTFAQTENSAGEPVDLARLAVLRAQWQLASGSDLEKVLRELRERTTGLGPATRLADAEAVLLEAAVRGIPDDADDRLETGGDLPHPIRTRLLEIALTIAALRGRFAEAHALFDQLSELGTADISTDIVAAHGYTLLGEGRHAEALAWAERGVDEAHANLDVSGLRAHSFVAALCLTVSGQYSEAENVISVALALGEPPLTDLTDHIGIQALASVVAVRRDNAALGERLRADIAATPAAGTLIGRSGLAWSTAQLVAYRGQPNEAAQLLRAHSDHLHGIGIHSGSVFALLSALELNPDPAGVEHASALLRGMQSEFFDAHLAFLIARQDRDADAIAALAPRLTASGRPGLAVVAFRLAAEWLNEDGEHERAREFDRVREAFIADLPGRSYDATRMFATAINLTEREREISRLVASGLSNPQIAARLVLSVRTVESHLHRIMRKTSVSNRAELASLIQSIAA